MGFEGKIDYRIDFEILKNQDALRIGCLDGYLSWNCLEIYMHP
jgi:hypothetical protein